MSSAPATPAQQTLVTFLLDKSYSILEIKKQTMEAFNGYLDGLKKEGAGVLFSLVQFDTLSIERICVRVPVAQAPILSDANYTPAGGTPLIDAAWNTIHAVEESLANFEVKPKIVVCIQTDGEENASSRSFEELAGLIKEKTAQGWQFNFMGCGIDGYAQSARMGIAAANAMSYDRHDVDMTRAAFAASAANTAAFAAGRLSTTAYSDDDRRSAGDAYFRPGAAAAPTPAIPATVKPDGVAGLKAGYALGKGGTTPAPGRKLDLTTPLAALTGQAPVPRTRAGTVERFSL